MCYPDQRTCRAQLARAYCDAIERDPLGDPRSVETRSPDRPRRPATRIAIVLITFIVVGVALIWA